MCNRHRRSQGFTIFIWLYDLEKWHKVTGIMTVKRGPWPVWRNRSVTWFSSSAAFCDTNSVCQSRQLLKTSLAAKSNKCAAIWWICLQNVEMHHTGKLKIWLAITITLQSQSLLYFKQLIALPKPIPAQTSFPRKSVHWDSLKIKGPYVKCCTLFRDYIPRSLPTGHISTFWCLYYITRGLLGLILAYFDRFE